MRWERGGVGITKKLAFTTCLSSEGKRLTDFLLLTQLCWPEPGSTGDIYHKFFGVDLAICPDLTAY